MNLTDLQNDLIGDWTGTNLLRTPWLTPPESNSPSRLSIAPVAMAKFLAVTYTWSHENIPHEGLILLGHDKAQGITTAAWVDSWHMSAKIMSCQGSIDQQGVITLRGSYEAPPGPDWGWRITIASSSGTQLQIIMHNCSPEGTEELAVQADYTRTA